MLSQSTDNDAAIAEALAREEQERADAEVARQMHTGTGSPSGQIVRGRPIVTCPGHHGLHKFSVSPTQRVWCNLCHSNLARYKQAYSCVVCNYHICTACYKQGGAPATTTQHQPQPLQRVPFSFPGAVPRFETPAHMCIVPCVIGNGVCIEMMVDTGAQMSVISLPLARELGLEIRIDRRHQGVAAGVGRAQIVGKISNVICELGHVEFPMDFIVLDAQDKILLLGLDLMRRYKCIVDLEKDVLIFGGRGGVEVALLPADEQHIAWRNQLGCPLM